MTLQMNFQYHLLCARRKKTSIALNLCIVQIVWPSRSPKPSTYKHNKICIVRFALNEYATRVLAAGKVEAYATRVYRCLPKQNSQVHFSYFPFINNTEHTEFLSKTQVELILITADRNVRNVNQTHANASLYFQFESLFTFLNCANCGILVVFC